jgi:4-hydroxy-4-methyl-2-oxoglutarate aldolase
MRTVVVTGTPRPRLADLDALAPLGVATVHEALGRTGYLGPGLRPVQTGARIAGSAVTALCWPGDNLMIHAAVEQCGPGDVLVVTTTSPCADGLFGELFATALQRRGVRGVVTTTGVRDTAELREMGFPAWSAAVSAQGTVKATAGAVNVPVTVGGQLVRPGDAVLADDDGVMVVARAGVPAAVTAARARVEKEAAARAAVGSGELGLDRYGMRPLLDRLGVRYVTAEEYARDEAGSEVGRESGPGSEFASAPRSEH